MPTTIAFREMDGPCYKVRVIDCPFSSVKDVFNRAKAILANATATSAEEEFAYFIAKTEIEDGTYSEGLMGKAFALNPVAWNTQSGNCPNTSDPT